MYFPAFSPGDDLLFFGVEAVVRVEGY